MNSLTRRKPNQAVEKAAQRIVLYWDQQGSDGSGSVALGGGLPGGGEA